LQVAGALAILGLLGAGAALLAFQWWAHRDAGDPDRPVVEAFEVRKGDSLRTIAERLEKQEIAGPAPLMIALGLKQKADRRLVQGRYQFHRGAPPAAILDRLTLGPDIPTARVTIPEGWAMRRVADRLAAVGVIEDVEAFLALARDPAFLETLRIPGESAEGYLFPDTYFFETPTAPDVVLRRLVERFREVIAALSLEPGIKSPHAHGLTFAESVVLASIIEREVRDPSEMPLVSAVFHNRLRRGMRLDSCATVRHAIDKWDAPLTLSDLRAESPFNTYTRRGLPPAPICNPGRVALDAAFRPVESDNLYFVYRGDGRHAFSKTLREHEALRRQYRDAWALSASRQADGE